MVPGLRGDYLPLMRKEAERLIRQSERDLENAAKNITIDAFEVAAFLCCQAVEKYLKALWMHERGEGAPWTHSLTELGDALGVPSGLRPRLVYLNVDYTAARYPDAANGVPYEVYDRATAESKVEAATEVFEWLRERTRA